MNNVTINIFTVGAPAKIIVTKADIDYLKREMEILQKDAILSLVV